MSPAAGCAPGDGGENVYPAEASEAELIARTRDRLAYFKCPAGVTFAPALARTASGKLQKQAIRATLATPAVP
jgi:acyl-coenzyme A synthetase/AMP-(fatty) acid ligase